MNTLYFLNSQAGAGRSQERFESLRPQLPEGHVFEDLKALDHFSFDDSWQFISVGGDGTFHQLVNRVIERAGMEGVQSLHFGHIGTGSNNSVIKTLHDNPRLQGIPVRVKTASERQDIGQVQYQIYDGSVKKRYFLANGSFGLNALANRIFNQDQFVGLLKKISTTLADITSFLKALLKFQPLEVSVRLDDGPVQILQLSNLHIIKMPFYAGDFRFEEDPGAQSGFFHVHWLQAESPWKTLLRFLNVSLFKRYNSARTHFYKAKCIEIEANTPLLMEMDGELVEAYKFTIDCLQGVLNICR